MSSFSVTKAHIVTSSTAKNVLSADELELFELSNLAGVAMQPKVFKWDNNDKLFQLSTVEVV